MAMMGLWQKRQFLVFCINLQFVICEIIQYLPYEIRGIISQSARLGIIYYRHISNIGGQKHQGKYFPWPNIDIFRIQYYGVFLITAVSELRSCDFPVYNVHVPKWNLKVMLCLIEKEAYALKQACRYRRVVQFDSKADL